jgi:hypothetical protein
MMPATALLQLHRITAFFISTQPQQETAALDKLTVSSCEAHHHRHAACT